MEKSEYTGGDGHLKSVNYSETLITFSTLIDMSFQETVKMQFFMLKKVKHLNAYSRTQPGNVAHQFPYRREREFKRQRDVNNTSGFLLAT